MTKCFFVTGTDTNIGKTIAACALLQSAAKAGYSVAGYKPISTGCKLTSNGPRNYDVITLMSNSNVDLSYSQVNPLAFIAPTSPHIASLDEGRYIDISILSAGLRILKNNANWLVIEGVGGWFTPLGRTITYADWVTAERLPVIMVVGMKLGCINHALLTALAIKEAGLLLIGWIANYFTPISHRPKDYLVTLQNRINAPLLGIIPWLDNKKKLQLNNYINISLINDNC